MATTKRIIRLAGMLAVACLPSKTFAQALVDVTNEAAIEQMANQSFTNFKNNKWKQFTDKSTPYWGWMEKDGTGYRYYWEQNLCMMATAAIAEYGTHPDASEMCDQVTAGFSIHYNNVQGIDWNEYIDDLGWNLDAHALAYRHLRKKAYLDATTRIFNTGFKRGNLGPTKKWPNKIQDGREGLWWRVPPSRWQPTNSLATQGTEGNGYEVKNQDHYKSPLSTSPHVEAGAMLYVFTGDEQFLDKADKMWQWELDSLWDKAEDHGIYEGWNCALDSRIDKDGNVTEPRNAGYRGGQKLHHVGTFLEATNALYQATGDEKYLAWCWKMVNSVLVYRLDSYGIIQNVFTSNDGSWCWEFARGMTNFVADNSLWDYKGTVPLIEGTYVDCEGKTRTYTTKVNGQLKGFPNGWTAYQWMAACASRIKDNNATCIVLPTNRNANAWYDLPIKAGGNLTLEAEEATLLGNAVVLKDLQASGGNTVTISQGSWISFISKQNEEGYAKISIIYATGEDSQLSVMVNDQNTGTYDCPKTGEGNKLRNGVDTLSVGVFLLKGENEIRIGTDEGIGPNIDKIIVKKLNNSSASTSLEIEAEKAELEGTAEVTKDLQASGGNKVSGLGNGSWLSFEYTAPIAGNYDVTVLYMCDADLPLAAKVNDGSAVVVTCPSTGGTKARDGLGSVMIRLYLEEGLNTISLGHDTEACPLLDKISLEYVGTTTEIIYTVRQSWQNPERLSGWYSLQGQKLQQAPTQRGIYILNGKKVFVND